MKKTSPAKFRLSLPYLLVFLLVLNTFSLVQAAVADELRVDFLYLKELEEKPPALSNILPDPEDSGLRGAELGVSDNNTTGRFLKQKYVLTQKTNSDSKDLIQQARSWLDAGAGRVILADMSESALLELMKVVGAEKQALVFNVGNASDSLRTEHCQPYLLHTLPSRAMLADALLQFLVAKKWNKLLLLQGQQQADQLFAEALQRSTKRFGASIIARKTWSFDTDLRRSAQKELPLFTQTKNYDVTLVADEAGDVGEFIPFNTWYPRPVAGTQGLTPVAWHRVIEQWGAAQLQKRFDKLAGRWMNSVDYGAWAAARSVGEAVTRTKSADANTIYDYLLSDRFELAGFKGRSLSYRNWNGQLRQPVSLVHPRALVSQSPQEGFLHPVTELDTLGYDRQEVKCRFKP